MSAEVGDVTHIQDEDLLRRMWQQTDDFGRKKEIRARMYKLREQRLKEFYTTGEVLSDVLSTSTSSLDGGRRNISSSNLIDTSLNSQKSSSQIMSKSLSYTTSSSGGGYSMTHADSLADEGFLTLKSKEIRDSESPTREFNQRQERNAMSSKSESSSRGGEGGGYWRIVQESSSGASESTGTVGEGGDMIIHTTSRNERQNLAGDSEHEGFNTATQVSSSENTSRVPRSGNAAIAVDTSGGNCVITTSNIEDVGGLNLAALSNKSYSGKWSSSSSNAYSASSSKKYEQNEKTSTTSSSVIRNCQDSKVSSGLEDSSASALESTKFSSTAGASHDIISSSTTASNQINNNQSSKHRVTQRSQTGELIGRTTQSTNDTPTCQNIDLKSPANDKPSGTVTVDVTVTSTNLTKDGKAEKTTSSSSNKVVEQRIMSELHKLDSFLSAQNMATDTTPVSPGDAHDSSSWTVVSTDKNRTVNNATDEFVFRSGRTTQDKNDSTTQQSSKFIDQEKTSSVNNSYDVREPVSTDKISTTIKEDLKKPTSDTVTPASGGPKRGTPIQEGTDTTGQYLTTYQQAYTNKRISVDHSPTHEAFARSLRSSPERATPPSSTRSSSKTSLDRSSPDRFNKSPNRSYRNRTSLDNTLASGRTSPDKTLKNRSSPTRASPEKYSNRISSGRSSPEKTPGYRSSPSRVSPEKLTKCPERTSPTRDSPGKTIESPYSDRSSPTRASPEKARKSPTTDRSSPRISPEKTTKSLQNERSPSRTSPERTTRLHAERTSPTRTSPDMTQTEKTPHIADRRVSSGDRPRDSVSTYSPRRKTSDSTKTYSSVSVTPSRDLAIKATTTKEKRKLSSGLSRATTKKRSSTPGVSPHTSPTRTDEGTRHTERQSRPRSRGSSSRSGTDTEGSDTDVKSKKTIQVINTEDEMDKSGLTNIIRTTTDSTTATTHAVDTVFSSKPDEQAPKGRKPSADYYPQKDCKSSDLQSEDDGPGRSPVLSSLERAPERPSNITTEEDTAKTPKRKDSIPTTAKTPVKKLSKGEPFHPTGDRIKPAEKISLPQKSKPDDVGTKILHSSQKPRDSSPSRSHDFSPAIPTESPKSVLDKLPRDKSPEYSSEGSLVNELYPKKSTDDAPRDVSSPVKYARDITKDSPDSSPERGNFKPIKCFRTSPEVRPSTLEFAHPQKQTPVISSSEESESPTKPFKRKPGDDDTTEVGDIDKPSTGPMEPLTEPSSRREPIKPSKPISTRDIGFKKSPERPNTSPAFENKTLNPTTDRTIPASAKGKPEPSEPTKTFPSQPTKWENKDGPLKKLQSPTTKRTPDNETRKYSQDLVPAIVNGAPEQKRPGQPFQPSENPEEGNPDSDYEQLPESTIKAKTRDVEVDENNAQPREEPKSSSISPCSSSPERPLSTATAEITLKFTPPVKKRSPLDQKPSQTAVPRQQYSSDCSPERGSPKRHTTPMSTQPQKPDDTAPSKQTSIPNRVSRTPHSGPATPEKPTVKKLDRSLPSPSQSSEKPRRAPEPSGKHPESKIPSSADSNQKPISAQIPRRLSQKSSPSPDSSPDRTSPNRSVPDSRRSPFLSPERGNDREICPNKVSSSPDRSPTSSPERHRSPVKIRPSGVKPSTKPSSRLPQRSSPSTSPDRRSRIPSSCIRDRPSQSPVRLSQPTRPNQNVSRPSQSPMRPTQQSARPNQSPARPSQSPARPSQPITRTALSPVRFNQSPTRTSPSPLGPRYQTEKPRKPGPDIVPIKSAFVRTPRKPEDNSTHSPRTGRPLDHYPSHESPSKQPTRYITKLSPSTKGYPTKEPKPQKPDEIDDEHSTDRSSTVSSPETVKTAGDNTTVDATYFASTHMAGEQISATSCKHTEMYVPQLSRDRDTSPSDSDRDEKPVSLSTLTGEIAPTSVTISVISNKKPTTKDILQNKPREEYYSDEYDVDDLQDETPPEEFLVDDDSPIRSPYQSRATPKPKNIPAGVRGVPKSRIPRDESPRNKPTGTTTGRTITVTAKITKKPTTRNEPKRPNQEPRRSVVERRTVPTGDQKSRPKVITSAEIRITRSSSDKNVVRKQTPSPSDIQPRRQRSKPDMTVTQTTVTRNTRHRQVTTVATATTRVSTTRTTKIPGAPMKPIQKKVAPQEPNKTKDRPRPTANTTTRKKTVTKNQTVEMRRSDEPTKKKLVNGVKEKAHTSSSEDEQEVPEADSDDEKKSPLTYTDDEPDETYIRELEELRRTDEQQYAAKVTAVRTLENKHLSPNQDIPGIIIQPLKSSRESSPEYPRRTMEDGSKPRYADRVSEPEDDDDIPGRYRPKQTVFQKPIRHPEAFDEVCTDDDIKPKGKQPGYVIPHSEQVTDLDEESETDDALKSVSVADRVSRFLKTTRNAARSVVQPSEPARPIDSSPKSLDSPSTVRRARAMFETIANTQTSTQKDSTRQKDILNLFETSDSPRESPTPDSSKPNTDQDMQRGPGSTSPFSEGQFPDEHDILGKVSDTKYHIKKPSINDYPADAYEDSPCYRDSYICPNDDVEKPGKPLTNAHLHCKLPSPERPSYQETFHTQSHDKSPTSKVSSDAYPRDKPSTISDHPGNSKYDTYTKVKPKESIPVSRPTITQPEILPNKYDTFARGSKDKPLRDTSTQKDGQPVKKTSQQEPSSNTYPRKESSHDEYPEGKDFVPTSKDLLPKKEHPQYSSDTYPRRKTSQDTYPKEKDVSPTRNEKETPQDTYPRRQPVQEFPEDNLIQTFTKDTTTQREILRQKDILNRPSIFEARRLGQKLAPSTKPEQYNRPYDYKTSGYPNRYPSDDDIPATSEYSTDTFTKKKPSLKDILPSCSDQHPQGVQTLDTAFPVRRDSQPKKEIPQDFSTDTYPRRKPSEDDTSPTRKDSIPSNDPPIGQDIRPGSIKEFSTRINSHPTRGTSPSQTSPILRQDQSGEVGPSRKGSRDSYPKGEYPRESSPTRKYSTLKDTSPTRRDSYPRGEYSGDSSPTRNYSTPKDASPRRNDSYPRGEYSRDSSPTRKYSTPKDTSPRRKDSYPRGDYPRDSSPTRKYSTPKDTSPTKRDSYPRGEYPGDSSPTRKYSIPKETSPKRNDSYPRGEYPGDSSPTIKYSTPKETSPTRKDSCPKGEYPRDSSPTRKYSTPKETSPTRQDSNTRREYPRDSSPTRKDSYPRGEFPRDSSPTRKYSTPKDTSPTSKNSYPRDSSPTRKYSTPKDTSIRKDSYPRGEYPRDNSPTSKYSTPNDDSLTRKDSYSRGDSYNISSPTRKFSTPRDSSPTRKDSYPRSDTSSTRKDSYPRHETPRDSSPMRQYSTPRKESHSTRKQPSSRETSPKRMSPTRPEIKSATPRKDSELNRFHPKEEPKPVETSTVRGSGRFGVSLRHTGSSVSSTIRRRFSGEVPKPATTPDKKEDEPNIEEIFDLELLERMLELAVAYEQRRNIRVQIRIVRKLMEERPKEPSSESDFEAQEPVDIRREPTRDDVSPARQKPITDIDRRSDDAEKYRRPSQDSKPCSPNSKPVDIRKEPSRDDVSPTRQRHLTDVERRQDDAEKYRRPSQDSKPYSSHPDLKPVDTRKNPSRDDVSPTCQRPLSDVERRLDDAEKYRRISQDSKPYGSRPDSKPVDFRKEPSRDDVSPTCQMLLTNVERRPDDAEKYRRPSQDSKPYGSRPNSKPIDFRKEPSRDDMSPTRQRPLTDVERRPNDDENYRTPSPGQDSKLYSSRPDSKPVDFRKEPSSDNVSPTRHRPLTYVERRPDDAEKYRRPLPGQVQDSKPYGSCPDSKPIDIRREPSRHEVSPTRQRPLTDVERRPNDAEKYRRPSPGQVQDSRPYGSHPDSKHTPERTPDWRSSPVRKPSKSELSIELRPAASSPVKSPIKKSSLGEPPREAFPTDSVTSSYGVGPTDENGRPLFGLRALRQRQNTNNNIEIPQDTVDNASTSEPEPEDKPQQIDRKPSEICDSSGRPLFGGLRALKATTVSERTITTSKGSTVFTCSLLDKDDAPSTDDDGMPEQPISSHLRELVTKHEQNSRGNTVSQPTVPRQKPRAKLRDSFIQRSHDTQSNKHSTDDLIDTRVISHRANSLRDIIQKHEKIAHDDTGSDRVPHSDEDSHNTGDNEVARRPGILKKPRGGDQVVTETSSTSSATLISSRGTLNADGKVSLTRDIIHGESEARSGEEPVSRITRTKYFYNTPEEEITTPAAVCNDRHDYDQSDIARKSSVSSRRSSTRKTPSPERGYPDDNDDVKSSKITTSAVTNSNSTRRYRESEDDRKSSFTSKYDKINNISTRDDVGKRSRVTADRTTEDDKKFVSSTTTVLSRRQKVTDEDEDSRTSLRPSPVDADNVPEHSTCRNEKHISSSTIRETGRTPASVRRQIFTDDDERDEIEDTRKTSTYSNASVSSKYVTGKETSSSLLDSERKFLAGSRGSGDDRRSPLCSDGDDYRTTTRNVSRTVTESDTPRSSRRFSTEVETDGQVQRSEVRYSSSSVTQSRSGVTTTVETTASSRSSTPNQTSGSGRRRSSATFEGDRESSPTGSTGFSRVARGGSVRALSQKFQQAAGSANLKHSADVCTGSAPSSTPLVETEGRSFLTNQTHVTGVQDVLTRMKNADQDVKVGDTEEDAEARSLLNKFLGAQVILQGMEPLVKASQSQSAALVSQVERQRVLTSQKTLSTNNKDLEQDLEEIWDERLLRQVLEKCSDYEGRRQIRARLRVVMAEQKACAGVVAAALADEEAASEREQEETGEVLRHSAEEGHSESKVTSSSTHGDTVTQTEVMTKTSSFSATAVGKSRVSKAPLGKVMSPFAKFQQLDRQSSSQSSPRTFK